jgi:thioredoxin reductase (NADPH)
MSVPTQSIIGTRRHQMFPTLEPAEIERLRRFGEARSFSAGEALVKVGEVGHGLTIMANWLSWRAGRLWWTLTRRDRWRP